MPPYRTWGWRNAASREVCLGTVRDFSRIAPERLRPERGVVVGGRGRRPPSPKQLFPTGNDVSTYRFSVIDLAATGPFVIDAPAGVLGGIVDYWQRAVLDIGPGETARGARLLLLPPGHTGAAPGLSGRAVPDLGGCLCWRAVRRRLARAPTLWSGCSARLASIHWLRSARRRPPAWLARSS
ncbi:MAG: hypothetical protein C0481_03890 [Phenylobacterium sp.]|uniref:DUF1254 domain-containing protein n=1 Tax=Phenylobacterium sp. TaxID=1871053 RepID=UPI0034442A35|nr:hypothetical protein [Phenylobacterium sp.]